MISKMYYGCMYTQNKRIPIQCWIQHCMNCVYYFKWKVIKDSKINSIQFNIKNLNDSVYYDITDYNEDKMCISIDSYTLQLFSAYLFIIVKFDDPFNIRDITCLGCIENQLNQAAHECLEEY